MLSWGPCGGTGPVAIEELCRDTGNVSYFSGFVIKELRPLNPQRLLSALSDTDG